MSASDWVYNCEDFRASQRKSKMTTLNPKSGITRRGFFERGAGLFATAGIFAGVSEAKEGLNSDRKVDVARTDPAPMTGKIALEEHFAPPRLRTPTTCNRRWNFSCKCETWVVGESRRWIAAVWNSASSRTLDLGSKPFPTLPKRSPLRGGGTTIWQSTLQNIRND